MHIMLNRKEQSMHEPSYNKITHENEIDTYVATRAYPDRHEHCTEYTSPLSAFN